MKIKSNLIGSMTLLFIVLFTMSCSDSNKQDASKVFDPYESKTSQLNTNNSYDIDTGIGNFKYVKINKNIDESLANNGEKLFIIKCGTCHKLTHEVFVGPGLQDITTRKNAAWILNLMTNTDLMIEKDAELQAQLEICKVKMPNPNLSESEALSIYEFLRKNDKSK